MAHPAAGLLAEGAPLAAPDGLLPQLPPHSLVMAMLGEALAGHSSGGGGPAGGGMAGGPQQQHAAAAGDAQFLHPQQQQQQQQHMMMMAAQQQQQQQVLAAGGFGGAAAGPASSMMVELPVRACVFVCVGGADQQRVGCVWRRCACEDARGGAAP